MPHTDTIPVSASIASTGKGIRYIGNWAYAVSGEVDTPGQDTDVTLLDFTCGSGFIVAKVLFGVFSESNNNISFSVKFNGAVVMGYTISGAISDAQSSNYLPLIIPPFTRVECIGKNLESANAIPLLCSIAGRVYGA